MADRNNQKLQPGLDHRHRDTVGELFDRKAWSREVKTVAKDYFSPITAVANTIAKNISTRHRDRNGRLDSATKKR